MSMLSRKKEQIYLSLKQIKKKIVANISIVKVKDIEKKKKDGWQKEKSMKTK